MSSAEDMDPFPGPEALGRGLVVTPGASLPAVAEGWPRLTIDRSMLDEPTAAVEQMDAFWRARQPSVVELAVPFADLKEPETCERPPYELSPEFTFERERLHFLVWANRYDGRAGSPRWHHTRRAERLGATATSGTSDAERGDVVLPDSSTVWIDGGPRGTPVDLVDLGLVHANQLSAGDLSPDRRTNASDDRSAHDPSPAPLTESGTDGTTRPGPSVDNGGLAPDQAAAVAHAGGPARVLAPAGSGKTRVLTARFHHLLADRGWSARSITALAYNTRAAGEMRQRLAGMRQTGGDAPPDGEGYDPQPTGPSLPQAEARTLHSLGYEILGRALGGRPKVLNEREVRALLEDLAPVRHRANDDVLAPYLDALAEVRAGLRPPSLVGAQREDAPGFADLFDEYRSRLERMAAIDHDEQIYGAVEVLLRNPQVRQDMQQRCSHLLVDELQDLTPAQLLMIRLLSAPTFDVYGVGDDDQVIYGYAGADPRFLVDYPSYFPGAASYLLEVNYRCPPAVVAAATNLLAHNRVRVPKNTRAAPPVVPAGEGIVVEPLVDERMGGRLVELVQEKLEAGAAPSELMVLTRVNSGLLAPQVLLSQAGVPVQPAVDERMLDRTGARAALAWLRLGLAMRDRRALDGDDLAAVARRPSRKLSPGILRALGRGEWAYNRLTSFADGLDDARLRSGLQALCHDLERLGRTVRSGKPTADLLIEVRDTVGLGGALDQLDASRSSARSAHGDDLDALILVARTRADPTDFEPWLRRTLRDTGTADGVGLSTVHRVKGLEWPHVVIWDASEGSMPHHLSGSGSELEEERRVFHVALTRARRSVTVLARAGAESPFLAEMAGLPSPLALRTDDLGGGRSARSTGRPGTVGTAGTDGADPAAERRVDDLKAWRRRRAEADAVPAYVVLNDRHLEGIAARHPQSLDELAACDGIGPTKLERYGPDILTVLGNHTEDA